MLATFGTVHKLACNSTLAGRLDHWNANALRIYSVSSQLQPVEHTHAVTCSLFRTRPSSISDELDLLILLSQTKLEVVYSPYQLS